MCTSDKYFDFYVWLSDDKPKSIWVEAVNCDTSCPVQITYTDEKAIGSGSFGVVYIATLSDDRKVAIKKVLQDKRYKVGDFHFLTKTCVVEPWITDTSKT